MRALMLVIAVMICSLAGSSKAQTIEQIKPTSLLSEMGLKYPASEVKANQKFCAETLLSATKRLFGGATREDSVYWEFRDGDSVMARCIASEKTIYVIVVGMSTSQLEARKKTQLIFTQLTGAGS